MTSVGTGNPPSDAEREETTLRIDRLDGERLVLDGYGLARGFFIGDPSSVAPNSYDSLAGRGARDQITTDDITAINTTMRARSSHQHWEPIANRDLGWLAAIDPGLDLLAADDEQWRRAGGARLSQGALRNAIGPYRGPSVVTKVLHLKRPRLFPVLDDFVAVMLGVNMPTDARPARRAELAWTLMAHLREQGGATSTRSRRSAGVYWRRASIGRSSAFSTASCGSHIPLRAWLGPPERSACAFSERQPQRAIGCRQTAQSTHR